MERKVEGGMGVILVLDWLERRRKQKFQVRHEFSA